MQKPLVPILVLAITSWIVFLIVLNYTTPFTVDPDSYQAAKVAYFLTALLSAITFSSTLAFFFIGRFFSGPLHQRVLLRRSLRRGFLLGLWVAGFLLMRLSGTYHLLNLVLMTAVLVGVEVVFKGGSPLKDA